MLEHWSGVGDAPTITASLYGLVNVCLRSGGWREAEGIYGQVLDKLRLSGDDSTWPLSSAPGADLKADLSEWEAAVAYYQESLVLLDRLGDFYSTAWPETPGQHQLPRGDWTAALDNYAASLGGI